MNTQKDWVKKWDKLEKFIYYASAKDFPMDSRKRVCIDAVQAKIMVEELLADARREVIIDRIDRLKLYEVIENIYLSGMYTHDKGILRQYISDIINVLATLRKEEK